jgi:hypothetical protein
LRAVTGTDALGMTGSVALDTRTPVSSPPAMATVTADVAVVKVAMVKGETTAGDRIWRTSPDGTTSQAVARAIRDLPHLVVESAFVIDDGLWAALGDASSGDPLNGRDCAGHVFARAATDAVVNLWRHGPNTPSGVRERLRAAAKRENWVAARIEDLAAGLDDNTIRVARIGVRRLYRSWRALPPGGTLRLTWPLASSPIPGTASNVSGRRHNGRRVGSGG